MAKPTSLGLTSRSRRLAGDYEFMVVARADDVDFVILRVGLVSGSVGFDVHDGLISGSEIGVAPSITRFLMGFTFAKSQLLGWLQTRFCASTSAERWD